MRGSRDGEESDLWPACGSINLSKTPAGQEFVELYERTTEAVRGRTVCKFVSSRPDLD